MDSYRPVTPRSGRGSYSYSPDCREPQTWHGPFRSNRNRRGHPPRRGSHRGRDYPRSADRGFRRVAPETPLPRQHDSPLLNYEPEPVFSPSSDREERVVGGNGFLNPPRKIPMIISPNTRERSYSEIMKGAFDLEKSPATLGKNLSVSAGQHSKDWLLQTPFGQQQCLEDCQPDLATPTRRGKRNASSQIGNVGKQVKADTPTADSDDTCPIPGLGNPSPFNNQMGTVTVGVSQVGNMFLNNSAGLRELLAMVQQNLQQSNQLADLVTNYINQHSADSQEKAPVLGGVKPHSLEDITRKMQPETVPRIPAIACGGDSPDPPRDNSRFSRGHMIDQLDIISKSPLKSPEPTYDGAQEHRLECQTGSPRGSSTGGKRTSTFLDVPNPFCLPHRMRPSEVRSAVASPGDSTRRPYSPASAGSRHSDNTEDHSSISSCSHGRSRWRSTFAPSPESEVEFLDVPIWGNTPATQMQSRTLVVSASPEIEPAVIEITPPGSSNASVKAQSGISDHENDTPTAGCHKTDVVGQCESGDDKLTKSVAQYLQKSRSSDVKKGPDSRTRDKRSQLRSTSPASRKDGENVHGQSHMVKVRRAAPIHTTNHCNPNSPCWHSGLCECTPQTSPKSRACPECGRAKGTGN